MNGFRFASLTVLALAWLLALNQTTQAQAQREVICKIYPLKDLGNDPNLGKWIADTLPTVIQPGSWNVQAGGKCTLSYFAPAKVLVVYHTAAVHGQVDDFLKNLHKAMPPQSARGTISTGKLTPDLAVVPAHYSAVDARKITDAAPSNKATGYLVPAPLQQPKHLFHLVFRYEGDGILDSTVNEVMKQLNGSDVSKEEKDDKTEKGKSSPFNQLFHFIIRYEGEGLVDENVVQLMKTMQGAGVSYPGSSGPVAPPVSYVPVAPVPTMPFPPNMMPPASGQNVPQPSRRMPLADEPPQAPADPSVIAYKRS